MTKSNVFPKGAVQNDVFREWAASARAKRTELPQIFRGPMEPNRLRFEKSSLRPFELIATRITASSVVIFDFQLPTVLQVISAAASLVFSDFTYSTETIVIEVVNFWRLLVRLPFQQARFSGDFLILIAFPPNLQ